MSVTLLLSIILGVSGILLALTMALYAFAPERRIRPEPERLLKGPRVAARMVLNSLFSGGLTFVFALAFERHLFVQLDAPWWKVAGETLAVLIVYDFLYYLLHRFPFHQWSVLKQVHAVHHTARFPVALDSLYLHPVENFLGLALLFACIWLVGPITVTSFGVMFFVYSFLNIAVHAGVTFPFPLHYFSLLARKHDVHHATMSAGNFASITPLPDLLFGTAESD